MDRIGWMSDLILLQGLEICYVLPFLFVVWQDIISLYQTDSKYFRLSSDGLSLARSPVCAVCVGSNPYPETFMAPRLALWHFTRNGAVRPQIKLDRLQCIWRHGWHNCLLIYWRNVAQLPRLHRFVYFCVMTQQDVHGDRERLPHLYAAYSPGKD